jgi:hypothetical protein
MVNGLHGQGFNNRGQSRKGAKGVGMQQVMEPWSACDAVSAAALRLMK